ncbi:S-layer homology domain-containing protein [Longirhabdus pacifica]|uniref:S-layer homology domain-containing protein n=1 Tax=Longirhabdus pacifica TaxID=2305227 RepID=UPI00100918FD|nr:S-layer homology domain-containing protein [Longirhabdus pacifica]
MKKTRNAMISLTTAICLTITGGSALAFEDIEDSNGKEEIMDLKKQGIVNGISDDMFLPYENINAAEGISLIVKALGIAAYTTYDVNAYDNIPTSWYKDALILASLHNITSVNDFDPDVKLTYEMFSHYIYKGIMSKGNYAFTERAFDIKDREKINAEYLQSINALLNGNIIELDDQGYLNPDTVITREDAAVIVHRMMQFLEAGNSNTDDVTTLPDNSAVAMMTNAVSDEINEVTLSWGEKPNSGYRISIEKIEFKQNKEAHIYYTLHYPQEGMNYLTVITYPKISTYIASDYKPILKQMPTTTPTISVPIKRTLPHEGEAKE